MNHQELFERFLRLNTADGSASPRTLKSYREGLASFGAWCNTRGLEPALAGHDELLEYRNWLAGPYKINTVRQKLKSVRIFYQALQRWGARPDNPAAGIRAPRDRTAAADRLIAKSLSPREIGLFLDTLPALDTVAGCRNRAMIELMLFQGLRVEEVTRLRLGDLKDDFTGLSVLGKGSKTRNLILCQRVRSALMSWLAFRNRENPAAPLFCSLDSMPPAFLTVRTLERIVDRHLGMSGLKQPGRSAHALRHSFAVLAVLGGAQREALADAMGHANIQTTDTYARAASRYQSNPAEAACKMIGQQEAGALMESRTPALERDARLIQ